ncbi:MAG: acyl-CoA dehydrogenase protein [Ilumatobacteraceae bacterium]|nr:acyl-CoA dehydrogenase protein [Ilumatobacteraceae bacterium]
MPGKATDNGQVLAARSHAHSLIAAAQTSLRASRLLLRDAAGAIDAAADADEPVTDRLRAELRAAMSHAALVSRTVLAICQRLGSSSALFTDNRLEQLLRDGNAASQHMILSETHLDILARLLLGQEAGTPLI